MAESQIVSHAYVTIGGKDLAKEAQSQLLAVQVDQHVHLPAMFMLRFHDPGMKLLDAGQIDLTKLVEISSKTTDNQMVKLISGEITALEPEFGEGMIAELTVRGYDRSHRLYRERKSKTYVNVKDSDLAKQIADAAKLEVVVDATPTIYDHLYQHNQSDLSFLRQRAWRIGYECYVIDKTLYFRKPPTEAATLTIAWGADLLAFRPRVALSEQVEEVWVKGWEVQKKATILGRASQGKLYPDTSEKDGKAWSATLKQTSRVVLVDLPVVSQAEADIVAAARLDELSGAFIEAEGTAFRRPDIQAGRRIKIEGLGKRLSGVYLVTSASHTYTNKGLYTRFTVTGSRTGLLSEQFRDAPSSDRWPGVVPAIVTNSDDPQGWGRVKLKYPWMSDNEESHWARVVGAGGGPNCGLAMIPDVEDEVMVAFEHGDFDHPVVLGGLWNGKDALPNQVKDAPGGEKPQVRSWTSRTGHRITMYDNSANKLVIETKGGLRVIMDDTNKSITVESGNTIQVTAKGDITIKGNNLNIEANGNFQLNATGNVQMKAGINANIEASALAAVKAPQISLG